MPRRGVAAGRIPNRGAGLALTLQAGRVYRAGALGPWERRHATGTPWGVCPVRGRAFTPGDISAQQRAPSVVEKDGT